MNYSPFLLNAGLVNIKESVREYDCRHALPIMAGPGGPDTLNHWLSMNLIINGK
jgi:hypothetical protein